MQGAPGGRELLRWDRTSLAGLAVRMATVGTAWATRSTESVRAMAIMAPWLLTPKNDGFHVFFFLNVFELVLLRNVHNNRSTLHLKVLEGFGMAIFVSVF